jgi:hypothetical protein
MAPLQGLEPRSPPSKGGVLPLNERGLDEYPFDILVRLSAKDIERADRIAVLRQANRRNAPHVNNLEADYETNLAMHTKGCRSEMAGHLFFGWAAWWIDFVSSPKGTPDFHAPGLEVDSKGVNRMSDRLIVQFDDDLSWAYLLICKIADTDYLIRGWVWGWEAKEWRDNPTGKRPAYFVPREAKVMKPPGLLRYGLRLHQAGIDWRSRWDLNPRSSE